MASLGWGLSDFLGGLRSRSLPLRAVVSCMIAGGLLTAAGAAAIAGSGYPGSAILLPGTIAGLASVTAIASLYKGLAIGSMSVVAPISAAYPIVPVAFGLAQGERPTVVQFAGMAMVVAGVVVASYVREDAAGGSTEAPARPGTGGAVEGHLPVVPLPDLGEGLVDRVRRGAAPMRRVAPSRPRRDGSRRRRACRAGPGPQARCSRTTPPSPRCDSAGASCAVGRRGSRRRSG